MDDLKQYSIKSISDIIPLDTETVGAMVDYALTIEKDADIINHFKSILGDSEDSLNFISRFLQTRNELKHKKPSQKERIQGIRGSERKTDKKPAWGSDNEGSKAKNPVQSKPRLANNKTSVTTSGLLDAKSTASKQASKKTKKRNIDNLKDIDAVLSELELNNQHFDGKVRVCNCMGTRHPLFEVAPNCLNCGKIICSKEGLQPCSFCGKDLLSPMEMQEIINILHKEKSSIDDGEKNSTSTLSPTPEPVKQKANKKLTVSMKPGENLWQAQDRMLKQAEKAKKQAAKLQQESAKEEQELNEQKQVLENLERLKNVDPDLLKAQERLNTLLHYQETGAERTKIIDHAADFDSPTFSSGSIWLTPVERALQLKKQQRLQRKNEAIERKRTGRGKKVLEMVISDGKVKMIEKDSIESDKEEDGQEDEQLDKLVRQRRQAESELTVWDPEKDSKAWKKPVYHQVTTTTENKEASLPDIDRISRARVQFSADAEENELLA